MSAWSLGRGIYEPRARDAPAKDTLETIIARVLTWIPLDAVAIFTGAITALVDDPDEAPAFWLIPASAGLAALFVMLGVLKAWKQGSRPKLWRTVWRVVAAVIAFLIWSVTVPDAGWQDIKFVKDNDALVVVVAAVAGAVFAQIADIIDPAA